MRKPRVQCYSTSCARICTFSYSSVGRHYCHDVRFQVQGSVTVWVWTVLCCLWQPQLHSWLQTQRLNLIVNQSSECCIFKEIQWMVSVLKVGCQGKISEDFLGILLLVSTGTHSHASKRINNMSESHNIILGYQQPSIATSDVFGEKAWCWTFWKCSISLWKIYRLTWYVHDTSLCVVWLRYVRWITCRICSVFPFGNFSFSQLCERTWLEATVFGVMSCEIVSEIYAFNKWRERTCA